MKIMKEIIKKYHDFFLTGISANIEENSLELTFEFEKQVQKICFQNVKRSLVNDFTIGNIVLAIESFTKDSTDKLLRYSDFKTLFDVSEDLNLKNILEEIKKGHLVYIEIQPSYGCTVQLVCEGIIEI